MFVFKEKKKRVSVCGAGLFVLVATTVRIFFSKHGDLVPVWRSVIESVTYAFFENANAWTTV